MRPYFLNPERRLLDSFHASERARVDPAWRARARWAAEALRLSAIALAVVTALVIITLL